MRNRIQTNTLAAMGVITHLLWMNFITGASADTPPHTNWAKLAFRTATDNGPNPTSAFIAVLDPKTFSDIPYVKKYILDTCTTLASTAVDA